MSTHLKRNPDILLSKKKVNVACFLLVLVVFLLGQLLIGTRSPENGAWTVSAPVNRDILYYAAQANQIAIQIPPQESAYAGIGTFQSWLPLVPVAWLMPLTGPYMAMRLLTIFSVLVIAFLFRRYFPDHWGILLVLLLITSTPKLRVHSLGIDALFKGFYHLPLYIALVVALMEKRQQWLRYLCLGALPWLHAFTSIAVFAFFSTKLLVYRDKRSLMDFFVIGGGIAAYKILFFSAATPPLQFFVEGLYFNPMEPILHVLLWVPLLFYCRHKDLWILFAAAFGLASFSHWQPFFFIYVLEFATALMVASSIYFVPKRIHRLLLPIVSMAVILFVLYATVFKFSRDAAVELSQFNGVLTWAKEQTPAQSVFLIAPPDQGRGHTELPMIQQVRAVYYGDPYVVSDLGLDPDGERYKRALQTYTHGSVPGGVDFVFYGPFERRRFPDFPGVGREVYRDPYVTVFDVQNRTLDFSVTKTSHPNKISLWGTFETEVINRRKYANPFTETELQASFTSPSGKNYQFFGFYDGDGSGGQSGNVWKLRFMCIETGAWTWSATFRDNASSGSGSFECVKGDLPGPLRVNKSNTRWLAQSDGRPFLPRWYYLGDLLFMKEGKWQQSVEKFLVEKNYNMVSVVSTQAEYALAKVWNTAEYEQPLFYPWLKNRLAVGALLTRWPPRTHPAMVWDKPDLASWHKLDRVLRYLQDRGIYFYNFDGFFPNMAPRFPDDSMKENWYLRYALARTGAYWNVIHNITFEFSEFMSTARLNRIGRYIKEIDPFNLLLTVHDTQNFHPLVQREDWIDLANLQYDAGRAGTASISNAFVLAHYVGKPLLSTEVVWEGGGKLTGDQVRRGAWGALLAGGFSLYGEFFPLNHAEGKAHPYLKIMLDFMEAIPFWTMSPHNDVVDKESFCLASPGKEYIIYTESGRVVTVDLSAVSGTLSVEWLNPRTGHRTAAGAVKGGVSESFKPPLEATDGDWVLHLGGSSQPRGQHASAL